MIVVDTNILVALEMDGELSKSARQVVALDPDWRLPLLWRVEFSNVLRNFHRSKRISAADAAALLRGALERYAGAETQADDLSALALAIELGLTAYDACYLNLARQLGCALVTEDRNLIRDSRGGAKSMAEWLSAGA